ncbi:MAG: methionine synthase, partial [Prochlorococcus sp.]|nr:methionine synthase [Prochlorococcus sp.]
IKQDVSAIIEAQKIHQADCIAMSGLLVKSTAFMKDNLQNFNEEGITIPVILGGAALTPRFVNHDCSEVYNGKVIYGKDAFTNLRFMDSYVSAKANEQWDDQKGFLESTPEGVSIGGESVASINSSAASTDTAATSDKPSKDHQTANKNTNRSSKVCEETAVKPPFVGAKILNQSEIPLQDVLKYLDRNALFTGQWQMRRTKDQSAEEFKDYLRVKAEPILEHWIDRIINESLLQSSVAYGYFPCGREDNKVVVFDSAGEERLGLFELPRQRSGNRYCIADFYRDLVDGDPIDFLPMQAVTMGKKASKFASELFKSDAYTDYLFFHGLAVQMAEALAEWTHARIREECGFAAEEPKKLRDVLAQRYRGSRYSFGYPACPNVADSRQQLEWLGAERIGLTMDASDQLHPEQSTTALVALHSQARYFSA